jgi:haloacetate dehalogenase
MSAGSSDGAVLPQDFDDLRLSRVPVGDVTLRVRDGGSGPPLLLLHGYPETHLAWGLVAGELARSFTVVVPDLRGYGDSSKPASVPGHESYGKRAMAEDCVALMHRLGFDAFDVAGHDRGGRVAYRMALDHPDRVERLAVLDVLPTGTVWDLADARFALAYWPWSLLAQPEPLPESVLAAVAEAVIDNALGGWGSPPAAFPPEVRAAYAESLRDPGHAHAICEEYRAAATIDREHDRADRASGRRVACPLLALWSARGPLGTWYAGEGGPIELWRAWGDDVQGYALGAGHFFPEEVPKQTADALNGFFGATVMGPSRNTSRKRE